MTTSEQRQEKKKGGGRVLRQCNRMWRCIRVVETQKLSVFLLSISNTHCRDYNALTLLLMYACGCLAKQFFFLLSLVLITL